MAKLVVTRKAGWFGRFRDVNLLVDGSVVGSISANASTTVDVAPGQHVVTVKMDWVESAPLEVSVADEETTELEAWSPMFGQSLNLQQRG